MVSTTIRPTKLKYPEFYMWQGCANFVSDHITYKPLNNPLSLVSQVTVFIYFLLFKNIKVINKINNYCFVMLFMDINLTHPNTNYMYIHFVTFGDNGDILKDYSFLKARNIEKCNQHTHKFTYSFLQ